MDKWIWQNEQEIDYITIPHWREQGVIIAFTARQGGVSSPPYQSLNMALHVGDQAELVWANRKRLAGIWDLSLEQMVCCQQIHGSQVACVNSEMAGLGAKDYGTSIPGVDALTTDQTGIILATFYADCLPIFYFDPRQRVVGIAHSGWKGTMGRIAVKAVNTMVQVYGSKVEDLEVFIGPGIGPCCFQIQADLGQKVCAAFPEFDVIMYRNSEIFWDLSLTNRKILEQIGIEPDKILECGLCTSCNTDRFFSYRRENGKTGRMMAAIGLQQWGRYSG
ncbi:MAG: peptidoglycan editing factor PgeF [Syntrophomonadaceae bacterium]|nr:peptidoglycan editing factor PgeF [Syntrophomonadaceae bacterium]